MGFNFYFSGTERMIHFYFSGIERMIQNLNGDELNFSMSHKEFSHHFA